MFIVVVVAHVVMQYQTMPAFPYLASIDDIGETYRDPDRTIMVDRIPQVGCRVASADRRKYQPEVLDIDAPVETGDVGLAGGFAFLPWTPGIATPLPPETSRDFIQTLTVTDAR